MPILLGYVAQPRGRAALKHAIRLASLTQDEVHVVNSSSGDQRVDANFASDEEMAGIKNELDAAGLRHKLHHFVSGQSAADTVLDLAEKVHADLIVIGMRRRSPTGKLLFGSDAQQILLHADCPVLAVKADEE
jgi:nucleotide-binding universal stress UspA family protein